MQATRTTWQQNAVLAIVPRCAALLIRALCATLRVKDVLEPGAQPADRTTGAGIYAFWHRSILLAAWRYRDLNIHILISPSFDGELIARTVQLLGFVPIRGSSSRGGAAGLLQMVRALEAGHKVAITADGPRGPARLAKPGVAALAARAGTAVDCFDVWPERRWRLRSWDGFVIPHPFSRVNCRWAAPVLPAEGSDAGDLPQRIQAALEQRIQAALERVGA